MDTSAVRKIVGEPLVLSSVSGILMGIAFLHPFFWWGGIIGLTLLLIAVSLTTSQRQAFWSGMLAGTLKMLMVGAWTWTTFPLDWMGDFSHVLQILGIGWVWFTGAAAAAIGIGCFGYIARLCIEHSYRYLLIPIAYVGSEVLGSFFFSIFEYGSGGSINIHSTFGYLGYTLASHGVLGLVAFGTGVYTLSLFVGLCAVLCKGIWDHHQIGFVIVLRRKIVYVLVLFFVFGSYFVSPTFESNSSTITIATVNTEFRNYKHLSQSEKAVRVRMLVEAFTVALNSESDVIVFPEVAHALKIFGTSENIFDFIRSQTTRDVVVMDSDEVMNEVGAHKVRAILYDTKTQTSYVVYKNYLVPGGEFLPYHVSFLLSLTGFSETGETLDDVMAFVPGAAQQVSPPGLIPGVLFCSESISPFEAMGASREATLPLILHPVSHAWFNHPETTFWHQLDLMARTQVRMVRTPLVQAANMWESKAYDAYGNPVEGKAVFETASTSVVLYEL